MNIIMTSTPNECTQRRLNEDWREITPVAASHSRLNDSGADLVIHDRRVIGVNREVKFRRVTQAHERLLKTVAEKARI